MLVHAYIGIFRMGRQTIDPPVFETGEFLGLPPVGNRNSGRTRWDESGLGLNQCKPFDSLEVAVAANQRCPHNKGGCRNPEIVLIQWKAAALLRYLHARVPIRGARRHGNIANNFPAFVSSSVRRRP